MMKQFLLANSVGGGGNKGASTVEMASCGWGAGGRLLEFPKKLSVKRITTFQ